MAQIVLNKSKKKLSLIKKACKKHETEDPFEAILLEIAEIKGKTQKSQGKKPAPKKPTPSPKPDEK